MAPSLAGAGALLARYGFIEPLLAGRRVLELGAAAPTAGESARFLAEHGASEVRSVEADEALLQAARASGQPPAVRFEAAEPGSLPDAAHDLVLLADGAPLAGDPDRAAALRRLLAPGGWLVTTLDAGAPAEPGGEAPVAASPRYGPFVSALAAAFPSVEIATQAPTAGWVFGLPSEGEPEVSLEGALAGTSETAAYVAICGEAPCGLRGLTVVTLPPERPVAGEEATGVATATAETRRAVQDAERLREEVATRAGENAILSREVERLSEVVRALTEAAAGPSISGAAPELERRLAEALRRAADAEAALARTPPAPLPGAVGPADALREATEARAALEAQLAERDAKVARLQREVADKTDRLGRLAQEMADLKARGLGKLFR